MRILVTGACGFVGNRLIGHWIRQGAGHQFVAVDNFVRPGSEMNRQTLRELGVQVLHGDIRCPSDLETLPEVDAVIDAAALPSVLAGVDGKSSVRQLLEHNLNGTANLLEFCRVRGASFILLSTSRVYGAGVLNQLPMRRENERFVPAAEAVPLPGFSAAGVSETFATEAPRSLYGTSKLMSEMLALEYHHAFGMPVWINRCGVLAGPGQFGHAEQGVFSFWLHAWKSRRPLRYIGFGGQGLQVRDALDPVDLVPVLDAQLACQDKMDRRVFNFGGGVTNSMSLRELSDWCRLRFGDYEVLADDTDRVFDVPWLVMDSTRAQAVWNWRPGRSLNIILEEIAEFAESHPDWLDRTSPK